jgi:hypothetical protein
MPPGVFYREFFNRHSVKTLTPEQTWDILNTEFGVTGQPSETAKKELHTFLVRTQAASLINYDLFFHPQFRANTLEHMSRFKKQGILFEGAKHLGDTIYERPLTQSKVVKN